MTARNARRRSRQRRNRANDTKQLNLALQGGGAHGAYAWGVLDRLFEETVDAEEPLGRLGVSSKLNADWDFRQSLFQIGRGKATAFLGQHLTGLDRAIC
jgi:hypothetical protein